MINLKRAGSAALIAAALAFGTSAGATAAPMSSIAATTAAAQLPAVADSNVIQVQRYRGRRGGWRGGNRRGSFYRGGGRRGFYRGSRRGYGYRRNRGWNTGAYIGLGIAGALLADGVYNRGYAYRSGGGSGAMQACANRFRSFEWNTGMYTTYGGQRRVCPYLR